MDKHTLVTFSISTWDNSVWVTICMFTRDDVLEQLLYFYDSRKINSSLEYKIYVSRRGSNTTVNKPLKIVFLLVFNAFSALGYIPFKIATVWEFTSVLTGKLFLVIRERFLHPFWGNLERLLCLGVLVSL